MEEKQANEKEADKPYVRGEIHEVEGEDFFEHFTLQATPGQTLIRIDKYLAAMLPYVTRSKLKSVADMGAITVSGVPVKLSYKVKPNDLIRVMLPYPPPPELEAEDIPLDIRYEDEDLLIVHKPPGMVVHPALGHRSGTLVHGLLWHLQNQKLPTGTNDETRPGLVHRLDKNTSGIMVIAKSEIAMSFISGQFADRTSKRSYYAIVWGNVKEDEGTIIGNVVRSPRNRKIFTVTKDEEEGKHAITHYKVLERYGMASLLQLKLETGRTHQIRVHMKSIGHTLMGDPEYGGDKVLAGPKTRKFKQFIQNCLKIMPRQALHAKTLGFTHPATREWVDFDSELPEDFAQLREKLYRWAKYTGE